jgi:cyclic pyranopterin phosphate synthase
MPENMQFMPSKKLMSANELLAIAKIFVEDFGIRKIRITGGEPLLRKDAAVIINGLAALGVKLHLTTNAVFLHQFWENLEQNGLLSINVSLDTLNREKFLAINKRDEFNIVKKNIDIALAKGFRIKLNVVVKKDMNDEEVLDFIALTKSGNMHIRFIEFMPFSGNEWNKAAVVDYKTMLAEIQEKYEVEKLNDAFGSTSKSYQIAGFEGTFSFITTISEPFCESCNRIRLTADGKIRNCLFGKEEIDLLSKFRTGEAIQPLIIQSILAKKEALGGHAFQSANFDVKNVDARSMVAIGG